MRLASGAVALGLCFATGLPGERARRRAAGAVAVLGQALRLQASLGRSCSPARQGGFTAGERWWRWL
jgi:hypothetical protein